MGSKGKGPDVFGERAAGNGMLSRRIFIQRAVLAGAAGIGASGARAEPLTVARWMKEPGAPFTGYGQPSSFEKAAVPSVGVRYLLVNGVVTIENGNVVSGAAAGRALTSASQP